MKKKIFLISANKLTNPYPVYPVGLSYVATHLENSLPDWDVRILDLNLIDRPSLLQIISDEHPDYIGFSVRNLDDANSVAGIAFTKFYKSLIQDIRKVSSRPLIVGGAGFSICPKLLFDYLNPDFGIAGEGEVSLVELLQALEQNRDYRQIQGLVYADEGTIKANPRTTYLHNVDIRYDKDITGYYWEQSGMLGLQTKRGCPYNCIYCTYPLIEGSTVRTLNPDTIVDRLKYLKEEKDVDYVYFTDSVFNIVNDYNEELANKIIESGLRVKWGAFFSPTRDLDRKALELYKKAGLTHVEFGTESLSDPVLRAYGKKFTVADVFRAGEICRELEIHNAHFLIIGGYGETPETLTETIENSGKLEKTIFFPFLGMRIYPGTPLQRHAISEGVISPDDTLLQPSFYIAANLDLEGLKERVDSTGSVWVLPDEDHSALLQKLRRKKRKGPLWELLIR